MSLCMVKTQLLCTFGTKAHLDELVAQISKSYQLAFSTLYALNNLDDPQQVILTYNVVSGSPITGSVPESTISVHRKKATNTIYTINALNRYIADHNNGIVDKQFAVNWSELKNCILVTAYNKLKIINTEISHIITV